MGTEKRQISVWDVLYIIGKYSFSRDENPAVIEVQVTSIIHKRAHAYPTKGRGTFCFNNSDLGKTVFFNRDDAERTLRRILDVSD